jgi:hypothetical protein
MAQQPPGGYPPQPPGGPPPQPPPGGYPPQPPTGTYPQAGYGVPPARAARPGGVTAAGVLLIILGAFAALGGIIFAFGGAFLASADFGEQFGGQFGDIFGAAAGILIVVGIMVIAYAVFKIIAGAKVLGLRNGWRITGIVLCALAIVGWIFSLISAFQGGNTIDPNTFEVTSAGPNIGSIVLAVVFLAANLTTLILLARNGQAFRR